MTFHLSRYIINDGKEKFAYYKAEMCGNSKLLVYFKRRLVDMDTIEIYLSKLSAAKELYMEIAEKSGDDAIDCKEKLMMFLEKKNTPAEYKVYISDEEIQRIVNFIKNSSKST